MVTRMVNEEKPENKFAAAVASQLEGILRYSASFNKDNFGFISPKPDRNISEFNQIKQINSANVNYLLMINKNQSGYLTDFDPKDKHEYNVKIKLEKVDGLEKAVAYVFADNKQLLRFYSISEQGYNDRKIQVEIDILYVVPQKKE